VNGMSIFRRLVSAPAPVKSPKTPDWLKSDMAVTVVKVAKSKVLHTAVEMKVADRPTVASTGCGRDLATYEVVARYPDGDGYWSTHSFDGSRRSWFAARYPDSQPCKNCFAL